MRKSTWLLSAGLFAISTPAFAQSTQAETDTDRAGAEATQGATAEAGAVADQANTENADQQTGDIVVTATRRNEALSDIPLAVSAVTAQQLQNTGAADIRQLQQVSPSLLVSSTSSEAGAAVARIRGIGTVGDNPGLESSVGVFIDGVYRSRTGTGLTELGQIDRIEVLRGPQGTLFGRNTSAGLISIITAKPLFRPQFNGELTVGNYDFRRVELGGTGPITDTIAVRADAIYLKRDGFLEDVISGRDVNDRNRYLLRGQALYRSTDNNFSVRLIADYANRDEECCGAVYLPTQDVVAVNGVPTSQPSSIAAIQRGLGAIINDDPFDREISITPGQSYRQDVKDGGVSAEAVYDMGWGELTSITAYRYNKYIRGQDADFNNLDIIFRPDDGDAFNRFKTFSQELRLQGSSFNNRVDWLFGGYYANEKLRVSDNLEYGADFGRYSNCLVANNFVLSTGQAALLQPGTQPTCFQPLVAAGIRGALTAQFNAAIAAGNVAAARSIAGTITTLGAFAGLNNPALTAGPLVIVPAINFGAAPFGTSGFANLALAQGGGVRAINGVGLDDVYDQSSNNLALFTHNIFSITDALKLTIGARYTREKKTLRATLNDTGGANLCSFFSGTAALAPLQQLPCVIPSVPGGSFSDRDSRTESKLSGTAVVSFKPTEELLTYASYSRGYKAGGYNLDRSGLSRTSANNSAGFPVPGAVTTAADLSQLEFRPEINDAVELGAKYNGRGIDVNVALFRQLFRDFQLNTFNGLNFFVENVNGCEDDLGGADVDNNPNSGVCTGDTRAGVKSRGVEVEVFTRPLQNVFFNLGATLADTKYRNNLVGAQGRALSNALFQLPGRRLSNSSLWTVTGSLAWTPPIGNTGLKGLFYIDGRHQSEFNTGSDLDIEKLENGYTQFNGRVGVRGPDDRWAIELWAQNLFDTNYKQVAFDATLQGSCTTRGAVAGFCTGNAPQLNRSTQLFGAFLAEPRTFGLTLRANLSPAARAAEAAPPPPPPPPPPPTPTQTCPDGTVIEATAACPPPAPPPPPPPAPERG